MSQNGDEPDRKDIIDKNLQTLQVQQQKKRYAQARYYGEPGQSPLVRASATNDQEDKVPVHNRLGTIRRRRGAYGFPNNNGVYIKNRRILRINRSNFDHNRLGTRRTIMKKHSAQNRLLRIRQQQFAETMLQTGPQRLRLRRRMPMNYTVQVNNSAMIRSPGDFLATSKHSVCAQLNKQLQEEISIIQSQNPHPPEIVPAVPIHTIGYGMTDTSLHQRFSLL